MIPIVFENEHFILINKPADMLAVPSRFAEKDDRVVAGLILQDQIKSKVFPCHRLDFEVSGLMLFAKNAVAHSAANTWFERKEVSKIYSAVSEAHPDDFERLQKWQNWKSKIFRGKKRSFEAEHGKDAFTKARVVRQSQSYFIWELIPITGRSHQLRFEMAKNKFPIVGDKLYGSTKVWPDQGIALKAYKIYFPKDSKDKSREKFQLPEFIQIDPFSDLQLK